MSKPRYIDYKILKLLTDGHQWSAIELSTKIGCDVRSARETLRQFTATNDVIRKECTGQGYRVLRYTITNRGHDTLHSLTLQVEKYESRPLKKPNTSGRAALLEDISNPVVRERTALIRKILPTSAAAVMGGAV